MKPYTYLLINLFSIILPLLCSFEHRIGYYKKFKGLFLGIFISGFIFIVWDIHFTDIGVWGFNPEYLTGIYIFNLPLEEWLFFICIPYASIFIYESTIFFLKSTFLDNKGVFIAKLLGALLIILGSIFFEKAYTATTFIFCGFFLSYLGWIEGSKFLGRFFFSYLIILVPFFIVNGILTGTGIKDQVVWYNDAENLGIRMGTIPVEDSIYGMLMLLIAVYMMEKFKKHPFNTSKQ